MGTRGYSPAYPRYNVRGRYYGPSGFYAYEQDMYAPTSQVHGAIGQQPQQLALPGPADKQLSNASMLEASAFPLPPHQLNF